MIFLPHAAWQEVADFVGLFPSGELLLVVVDEFSRFPEVEIVTTRSSRAVIPQLDNIFLDKVSPAVLKTDNSTPFNSYEFEKFARYLGFEHLLATGKTEAERFMHTIEKLSLQHISRRRIGNKKLSIPTTI